MVHRVRRTWMWLTVAGMLAVAIAGCSFDGRLPPPCESGTNCAAGGDIAEPRDTTARDAPLGGDADASGDVPRSDVPPPGDTDGDGGPWRPSQTLSCNGFLKCDLFFCGEDDTCTQSYAARMPDAERRQRDIYLQCLERECSDTQLSWAECAGRKCGDEWQTCYTHPNGDAALTCGELWECRDACRWEADPEQCKAGCKRRAIDGVPELLAAYFDCIGKECAGTSGSELAGCAASHCKSEIVACVGC